MSTMGSTLAFVQPSGIVPVGNGGGDGDTERSRLASAAARSERHGGAQRLFRDGLHKRQDRLGLVTRPVRRAPQARFNGAAG